MMKRKGALSLSIEAIVIVVIAFVILGLGLAFVRGSFKDITETSKGVQEQIRQQILEDLRTGDKKLSFPVTTLAVERGGSQDIAIGVKNTGNTGLNFKIVVTCQKVQSTNQPCSDELTFFYDQKQFNLRETEAEAYNIKIIAEGNKDTYLVNLEIEELDAANAPKTDPYASKSFFVNII